MSDTSFQEELDMRVLSEEALEVLAMRPCSCKRGHAVLPTFAGQSPAPMAHTYRCLAHRAIDELEQRERREAQRG